MPAWTHRDSEQLYNVSNWGGGYFHVSSEGRVEVSPDGAAGATRIDLHRLIGDLRRRGIELPILLRFDGILRARVRELNAAFDAARAEYGYEAPYVGVFPIKVNQQHHVVDALLEEGARHGTGLEVGSKPELLAALALLSGRESLVVCNGYKDREYVETALLAGKLGLRCVIVIEKTSELETVLRAADELSIRPHLGVRAKLTGRGSGRWVESGGDRSKFGLTTREMVHIAGELERRSMLDCLELLHFHLGSQITHIRSLKDALRETTQTLVGLVRLGARIRLFDVGGGLGVNYDGSRTNFQSSMNYSLQEYANDVVYHLLEACRDAEIPQPTIVTESGRALSAHHAVLVTDVLGVSGYTREEAPELVEEDAHDQVRALAELVDSVTLKNYQEVYHDALQLREEAMTLFRFGQLSLTERAQVDELYWRTCLAILRITRELEYVPDDLAGLERDMADIYFLNLSIFQSIPDSWAIHQLFPVLPIHRLAEAPSRRAILADITCDSDGKIDRFIDLRDVKRTLELHPLKPQEPYYVGIFLVGAYQEILGDMHNLFGDTNAVHVDVNGDGKPRLKHVVRGDRVKDVLSYVGYDESELLVSLRRSIEKAIEEDRITFEESARLLRRYEHGLHGYTYLTRDSRGD